MNFEELIETYKSIDSSLTSDQAAEKLNVIIRKYAHEESDEDPVHLFFAGLAFLYAIGVKADQEKALRFITKAAESGLSEAYEKIISMYRNGDGVEKNSTMAIEWEVKYVRYLEKTYLNQPSKDLMHLLVLKIYVLALYQKEAENNKQARETFQMMLDYAVQFYGFYHEERWLIASAYKGLGDINLKERKNKEAKICYLKAYEICLEIVHEARDEKSREDLSETCKKLGELAKRKSNLSEMRRWYGEAFEIDRDLYRKSGSVNAGNNLAESFENLADISIEEGDNERAEELYLKAYELYQSIAKEIGTLSSLRAVSSCCSNLSDFYLENVDLVSAKSWRIKAYEIDQRIDVETKNFESRSTLIGDYQKLGYISELEDDYSEAREWYQKSYEMALTSVKETNTAESKRDLLESCNGLGNLCTNEKKYIEAKKWLQQSLEICLALAEETKSLGDSVELAMVYARLASLRGGITEDEKKMYSASYYELKEALADTEGIDGYLEYLELGETLVNLTDLLFFM